MIQILPALMLTIALADTRFLTGNDLLRICNSANDLDNATCTAYILGSVDQYDNSRILVGRLSQCLAGRIDPEQARNVVIQYLGANPTTRALRASMLIAVAISKAWNCRFDGPATEKR